MALVGGVDPVILNRIELGHDRNVAGVVGEFEVEADLEAAALGDAGDPFEEGIPDHRTHVLGVVVECGDDVMTDHGPHHR